MQENKLSISTKRQAKAHDYNQVTNKAIVSQIACRSLLVNHKYQIPRKFPSHAKEADPIKQVI